MTIHLIADPTLAPTSLIDPAWRALSVAMTDEVPMIADRDDLLVTIAPAAGRGAPACFLPTLATIEVDGAHLGSVDPTTATPHLVDDRARYAAAWGLLTHECAHARHSGWAPPPGAPPGASAAAVLLDESRIEGVQIRRRPDDRHWLRASATALILADSHALDPPRATGMDRSDAAQTAALLLARADAGILTRSEVEPVARAVQDVLGEDTLAQLRTVWQTALGVADTDADAMVTLGKRWCEILGTDPDEDPDDGPTAPGAAHDPNTSPDPGRGPDGSGPSVLQGAIRTAVAQIATAVAGQHPVAPTGRSANGPAAPSLATMISNSVFTGPTSATGCSAVKGNRPPTAAERNAARTLGRALTTAGTPERVMTKATSALPPGRLRMRGALAADAQRAAGAIPTAEPFTRTTRTLVAAPPLRLGVACDVSGSMGRFTGPVASAAWILSSASRYTPVPTTTATVIFGATVHPITHPGAAPAKVTTFNAPDGYHAVDDAVDALDGALALSSSGAARLLVIVSDGIYEPSRRIPAQARVTALHRTGCAVLWLAPEGVAIEPLDDTTVHTLGDPTRTAAAIGRAATAALRAQHRG